MFQRYHISKAEKPNEAAKKLVESELWGQEIRKDFPLEILTSKLLFSVRDIILPLNYKKRVVKFGRCRVIIVNLKKKNLTKTCIKKKHDFFMFFTNKSLAFRVKYSKFNLSLRYQQE